MARRTTASDHVALQKCPTGIQGLDEITMGGIPRGRPTLFTGGAGSGKTLMALEFLVKGATFYDEAGVFMAFEETSEELTTNVSSLGFDLDGLARQKKVAVDYVYIERSEIEETAGSATERLPLSRCEARDPPPPNRDRRGTRRRRDQEAATGLLPEVEFAIDHQ